MAPVIVVIIGIVACGGAGFILRNYRKQAEWREGPGKVPEDYS